jgi:release factor glutamine methyltransferase
MIKELRDNMVQELSRHYAQKESLNLVNWLFLSVAGIKREDFTLDPDRHLDVRIKEELIDRFRELMDSKPIQYVTGTAYFYDLELDVNPSVLIPRPETEGLVKWAADDHKNIIGLRVLDIGTGSGCILLALGRILSNPKLTGIDVSDIALVTATHNAEKYGIPADFKQLDILNEEEWGVPVKFDIIISNPPYVREAEKSLMKPNVLDYEPHLALFVSDNDPLVFYRAIAAFSRKNLNENGKVYVEINEKLGEETLQLFKKEGFIDVQLQRDLLGKDRMIRACV